MTLPRTAADVLAKHVVFEVESIDRLYLNLYVPDLQRVGQVVGFLTRHLGFEIPSTAVVAPRSKAFGEAIKRFAAEHRLPLVDFGKGQRKDDVLQQYLARCDGSEQVLFIGRAQEKMTIFRTERRRNPTTGVAYPWIVPATAMVNQFYVYAVDDDFGPFFIKFGSYFPYTGRVCLNGHEYAKRQAAKAGIGFTALDNGFAALDHPDDVVAVQAICDGLSTEAIDGLVRKWLARHPRWVFHFTPTSCSWLNAVEGFFARLSRRRLKRGTFPSLVALQEAINRFIEHHNQAPKPFTWKADPKAIIAAAKRGHQTLEIIH